jgi:hypothetical protein
MQKQIQDIINFNPGAHVLVFMTGFHTLKSGNGEIQTGGTAPVQIAWLASRLQRTMPEEVYSFLVDAPGSPGSTDIVNYAGTSVAGTLQRAGVNRTFVTRITGEFDALGQPLVIRRTPGLSFQLYPRDYKLSDVADAYVHLR